MVLSPLKGLGLGLGGSCGDWGRFGSWVGMGFGSCRDAFGVGLSRTGLGAVGLGIRMGLVRP